MIRTFYIICTTWLMFLLGATTGRAQKIRIGGNVYGGCKAAAVESDTHVDINGGVFGGDIFGGGEGSIDDTAPDNPVVISADVVGETNVNINGGKFTMDQIVEGSTAGLLVHNHNIYGGGNNACVVGGQTNVNVNIGMVPQEFFQTIAYKNWCDYVNAQQAKPIQAAVFGAGYGKYTSVADSYVNINLGTPSNTFATQEDIMSVKNLALEPNGATPEGSAKLEAQFVANVMGGGYDGKVQNDTHVTLKGNPYVFNVFGGGLGSASGAAGNPFSDVGTVYGSAHVNIEGGTIYGNVFGSGAGISGEVTVTDPVNGTRPVPYYNAAWVRRQTHVSIGKKEGDVVTGNGIVIFGDVYGGGDIANTGWYTEDYRPGFVYTNKSGNTMDITTDVYLNAGNILGRVFGGGNGRASWYEGYDGEDFRTHRTDILGSMCGTTLVRLDGARVWGNVYGGGKTGRVVTTAEAKTLNFYDTTGAPRADNYSGSTNVEVFSGWLGNSVFGGGLGDIATDANGEEVISSADIMGSTFTYFKGASLIEKKYWNGTAFADQDNSGAKRYTDSDLLHNFYGGGELACEIQGTGVFLYLQGTPTISSDYRRGQFFINASKDVGLPHFSVFGGGYGKHARVRNSVYSDVALMDGDAMLHAVGGGLNGPVDGACFMHVAGTPGSSLYDVYGGGYYAPVLGGTNLSITSGRIKSNVFGGGVMGEITNNLLPYATNVQIGLPVGGHVDFQDDQSGRSYTYENQHNDIIIGGSVYGGNDVSGHVSGIASLTINGGTIMQNVYAAGNGDHQGYYEPGYCRYDIGVNDNYLAAEHASNGSTQLYKYRPRTDDVKLSIAGNKTDERVDIHGQVFGGGNSCTVGEWNANKLITDKTAFLGGGSLDITIGSHVTIGQPNSSVTADYQNENGENVSGFYIGSSGAHLATQTTDRTDLYYHRYYDSLTDRYWPGFPVYDDNGSDLLTRDEGQAVFDAYLNNILVRSDNVSLRFEDDAEDIWIANFVGGGFRGSMQAKTRAGRFEYSIPAGVTIGNSVIGGAYNSDVAYRIFRTSDGHNYVTDDNGNYKYETEASLAGTSGEDYVELVSDPLDNVTGFERHFVRFKYIGGILSENGVTRDDNLVVLTLNSKYEQETTTNVYGACYTTGSVQGNVTVNYQGVGADNIYGGGNLGGVCGRTIVNVSGEESTAGTVFGGCRMANVDGGDDDIYSTTVNISDGIVNVVYGGNDVSGNIAHGTKINVTGGICGNIYGSGNGDYLYQWDKDVTCVTEMHDGDFVYYKVPAKDAVAGGTDFGGSTPVSQVQKLLTINSYHPSVSKALINMNGTAEHRVYVLGNVYCGGNASTVEGQNANTNLNIGSYVTINGLYMGSDGKNYTKQTTISEFENKNKFNMSARLTAEEQAFIGAMGPYYNSMLALYMHTVEMQSQPETFSYDSQLQDVYIGTFCGGGDRGSMLVNKCIDITIPKGVTIYEKIIAGCSDANVTYHGKTSTVTTNGGYIRPIFDATQIANNDARKFHYTIACDFAPKTMAIPVDKNSSVEVGGQSYSYEQARQHGFLFDKTTTINGLPAYAEGCNIYGGCYKSGIIIGDVQLDIKSNMLKDALSSDEKKAMLSLASSNEVACFNIYGAGFDMNSFVYGNVNITLDNTVDGAVPADYANTHPSCNNIYGGGRNGYLVGNASINIRNGIVYRHVIGGSDAGYLYGNTQIAVGEPKSYTCLQTGTYNLVRSDEWNLDKSNHDGSRPVRTDIKVMKGDVISDAVYQELTPEDRVNEKFTENATAITDWTNRQIYIGGGIYGGGYALATGSTIYAGDNTVRSYNDNFRPVNALNMGQQIMGVNGYGGNATVMVADATENTTAGQDHITISTLVPALKQGISNKMGLFTRSDSGRRDALGNTIYTYDHQSDGTAVSGAEYYSVTGLGGIYGDGHLSFVEGFRSADIQRYGYADHSPQAPKLLNTLQRLDVVRIKDCCIMLQGARDFATNAVDATTYSISRIRELKMESSIDPNANLDAGTEPSQADLAYTADRRHDRKRIRNYVGFFNNVHYIGCLATNDEFSSAIRHDERGVVHSETYWNYKDGNIHANYPCDSEEKLSNFRKRNLGTARNMIGINNGYTLKIQNVFTTKEASGVVADHTYYGPIVGVCEVKLLTLVQGEGGGYVYADNVHADEGLFLNTSGNFVFPGTVVSAGKSPQNIVDDCFPHHFGSNPTGDREEDHPAHYWYVEGNKYWFTNTLTGYTSNNGQIIFNMDNVDQIIALSGTKRNSQVRVRKIEWLHEHGNDGYDCDLVKLEKDYKFKLGVSDKVDYNENGAYMTIQRTDLAEQPEGQGKTDMLVYKTATDNLRESPLLSLQLVDNVNNNDKGYYQSHLSRPCKLKMILESDYGGELYTYNIDIDVKYLQGPRVDGYVIINNCALPGELINAEVDGLAIETDESMPVSGTGWQVNLGTPDNPDWKAVASSTAQIQNDIIDLHAIRLYDGKQIRYVVYSSNQEFGVNVKDDAERQTLLVHNYHDMKRVYDFRASANARLNPQLGARLYIRNNEGWDAFINYLNASVPGNEYGIPVGMEGLKVYLQSDINLSAAPVITQAFKGELNGDGYTVRMPSGSLFGDKLADGAKVYNLGLSSSSLSSSSSSSLSSSSSSSFINCFVADDGDDFKYGAKAYELSHHFSTSDDEEGYIHGNRYVGDDWQYARTNASDSRMLRTATTPNYGSNVTSHNTAHPAATVDAHDCLFFGQQLSPVGMASSPYPQHIDDGRKNDIWTESNRVYRTTGYHHSTTAGKYYYNKVAWALQPSLTAIDFSTSDNDDNAPQLVSSFSTDDDVTRNLLVYMPVSSLSPSLASGSYMDDTPADDIRYHTIGSDKTIANLHLVDKEDFCCPIEFRVTGRAWYERKPESYRNVDNGYDKGEAWDGICLPFTARKVTASENGEISHFYSADDLHHEYWLRGLTSVVDAVPGGSPSDYTATAVFARPAETAEHGFVNILQNEAAFNYAYHNSYFANLTDYDRNESFGKHYADAATTDGVTFTDYLPLTAGVPYIVSFPGDDFYEFSLEDADETVTFEADGVVIPVTTVMQSVAGDYCHVATFMRHENVKTIIDGKKFEDGTALPFRTYLMPSTAAASTRNYRIGQNGVDDVQSQPMPSGIKIWVENRSLFIDSDYDTTLPLYLVNGILLRQLDVKAGINRYQDIPQGAYVISHKKILM